MNVKILRKSVALSMAFVMAMGVMPLNVAVAGSPIEISEFRPIENPVRTVPLGTEEAQLNLPYGIEAIINPQPVQAEPNGAVLGLPMAFFGGVTVRAAELPDADYRSEAEDMPTEPDFEGGEAEEGVAQEPGEPESGGYPEYEPEYENEETEPEYADETPDDYEGQDNAPEEETEVGLEHTPQPPQPSTPDSGVMTLTVPVSWQAEPAFDGQTPGTYVFTAVIGSGFVLAQGLYAPQIFVTVAEAAPKPGVVEFFFEEDTLFIYANWPVTYEELLEGVSAFLGEELAEANEELVYANEEESNEEEDEDNTDSERTIAVLVADTGGLDISNPQPKFSDENDNTENNDNDDIDKEQIPYIITYKASHPETGEATFAQRELFVVQRAVPLNVGTIPNIHAPAAQMGTGQAGIWTFANNVVTILNNAEVNINSAGGTAPAGRRIVVANNSTATINFVNNTAAISLTNPGANNSALALGTGSNVTINHQGSANVNLTGGSNGAGINVPQNATANANQQLK